MNNNVAVNTTAWLVDIGYVVRASEGKFKLDYLKAERFLQETCGPTRTFLFNVFDPTLGIQPGLRAFYDAMSRQGMTILLHPAQLQGSQPRTHQCRLDVDFSAHLLWQAGLPFVETVVITTGEADFVPPVELARAECAKRVILFSYNALVPYELASVANEWWQFEYLAEQVMR